MKEERNGVAEVIATLQQKVSRCEYFPARSESPNQVCLNEAENCDVFIGIYKNRYGFIPDENNAEKLSICELEYKQSLLKGKPILLFYSDDSSQREPQLDKFLTKAKNFSKGHYVRKFRNVDELKYLVLQALVFYIKNSTGITSLEKVSLDNLIPDLIKYQKVLLSQFEYDTLSGISRPSALIQYRVRDLYVPPKLKKHNDDVMDESKNDTSRNIGHDLNVRIITEDLSWQDVQKIADRDKKYNESISKNIDILDKFQDPRTLVILGAPGSGKSTLTKFLCSDLILNSAIVPFYIQIRDLALHITSHKESIIDYLNEKHQDLELSEGFFLNQLNADSNVIIFDGLDEVWEPESRKKINELIQQFSARWSDKNKIIVTSREAGYYQHPLTGNLEILQIEPFDITQIGEFVYKWSYALEKNKNESDLSAVYENAYKFSKLILDDPNLEKLVNSPLILNIVCMVFLKSLVFPKRKHLLYAILVETLLSTREERKGIVGDLDWTDYVKILRKVAYRMFTKKAIQLQEDEISEIIKQKLAEEGLTTLNIKDVRKIITYLEDRSGLIINDGIGNYSFVHTSFLEYFVAVELIENFSIEEQYEHFKQNIHNAINGEIIVFLASLLSDKKSRKDSSEFLNLVLDSKTNHENIHLLDLLLVIWCLGNGALVTDAFKIKIFNIIDREWTLRRNSDVEFLHVLKTLLSTSYEDDLVNIWRTKHDENIKFYSSLLSDEIFRKSKYTDDLISYVDIKIKKTDKIDAYFHSLIAELLQNKPSIKLSEYILNNIEKFSIHTLRSSIIFGLAKFASSSDVIKEQYFHKIETLPNPYRYQLLQFSVLADKDRSLLVLNQLPPTTESDYVKSKLLEKSKPKQDLHQIRMNFLKNVLKNISDDIGGFALIEKSFSMREDGYDAKFVNELMITIERLPPNAELMALRISQCLLKIYEQFVESRDQIILWLNSSNNLTNWIPRIHFLRVNITKPSQEIKEVSKTFIGDRTKNPILRRFLLNTLSDSFSDADLPPFFSTLWDDKELMGNVLSILTKYPKEMETILPNIISYYTDNRPWGERYDVIVSAIRSCVLSSINNS